MNNLQFMPGTSNIKQISTHLTLWVAGASSTAELDRVRMIFDSIEV